MTHYKLDMLQIDLRREKRFSSADDDEFLRGGSGWIFKKMHVVSNKI